MRIKQLKKEMEKKIYICLLCISFLICIFLSAFSQLDTHVMRKMRKQEGGGGGGVDEVCVIRAKVYMPHELKDNYQKKPKLCCMCISVFAMLHKKKQK